MLWRNRYQESVSGAVQKAVWVRGEREGSGAARRLRRLYAVGLVVLSVALGGCMEALQPGALPGARPTASSAPVQPGLPAATTTPAASATAIDVAPASPVPTPSEPLLPTLEVAPTPPPESAPTIVLPTPEVLTNEARWRAQQIDRVVLDPVRIYTTPSSDLWWFDPVNQQSIILGTIAGDFPVQAEFVLRGQGRDALEIPYQINQSYGLTALSPAVLDRIAAAGYSDWIETYVFRAPNVVVRR
jgi:hypothetical protein